MYWNNRVIYKKDLKSGFESFEIHEVYYSKKGKIKLWTEKSVSPVGETKKILRKELKSFSDALKKPILEEKKKGSKVILVKFIS